MELQHHGIKGMRWGVRKTRKWATSTHQPSSAKSSLLAGAYAATGSKKIGRMLDKSNAKDAENWKKAKELYSNESYAMERLDRIALQNKNVKVSDLYKTHSEKR